LLLAGNGDEAMRPRILIGVLGAAIIAFVIFAFGMQLGARPYYSAGWWGPGMMGGYAMGPRMMAGGYGYGMGPWMMGQGGYGFGMAPWMFGPYGNSAVPTNLSVDDVKNYFGRWLAFQGNPHVKLGSVAAKDADTITADIVTTDKDGLVQRFAVNRHTGFIQPGEN
jgi:hypothetical protein